MIRRHYLQPAEKPDVIHTLPHEEKQQDSPYCYGHHAIGRIMLQQDYDGYSQINNNATDRNINDFVDEYLISPSSEEGGNVGHMLLMLASGLLLKAVQHVAVSTLYPFMREEAEDGDKNNDG